MPSRRIEDSLLPHFLWHKLYRRGLRSYIHEYEMVWRIPHLQQGSFGDEIEDVTEVIQGGIQTLGAGLNYAGVQIYNQALQYGGGLASAASAAGTISYGFRSPILNGLLDTATDLTSLAESVTSEAVVGEAGLVTLDVLLANALGSEIEAVRNGTCLPEGDALRIIIFGQ